MAALPALRPVACVASLNAAAQGLIGAILGILGLVVGFCGLGIAPQADDNNFGQYLTFYLQGDDCGNHLYQLYTGLTSPTALRVWLALSLFFSASMFVSSVVLFTAIARRWSDEKLQITLVSWLFINTFTAVDDVILGYVFGNDYLTTLDSMTRKNSMGYLTMGLLTLLVLRGVYLWLLNLAFILYLFKCARALHKELNEQMPSQDQQPIESWPTLDDFGKSKSPEFERNPTAINPRLTERLESTDSGGYPDYSARARWPGLNGEAQAMRESRPRDGHKERKSKATRDSSIRRQNGVDNPAYDSDIYYLRLQNDAGSSRDYDDQRGPRRNSRERSRREVVGESASGHYKSAMPPPPTPYSGYTEEHGVPIPPIDYLDTPEKSSTYLSDRPLSLQEAILDRTLRLKKVPEELKKRIN